MVRTSCAAFFLFRPVTALLLCVMLGCTMALADPPQPIGPSSTNPGASAAGSAGPPVALRTPRLARPGPIVPGIGAPPAPRALPIGGKGPIGYDHYRRLDAMPGLPVGVQTLQFSSFDRTGGNDDGFSGTYSCLRMDPDGCVIAERQGAGEIASIWSTRDAGDVRRTGNIKIELDGRTVLDAPLQDVVDGRLGAPFVYPLVANADLSSGGVYIKVPMPFTQSMRITTQFNPFFYHVTYRAFADASGVQTFNPADPANDVIAMLRNAGFRDPKPAEPGAQQIGTPFANLAPGGTARLADITGPGSISELRLRIPQIRPDDPVSDEILADTRLRISFDGVTTVDAPLGDFFGSGLGEHEVRSLFHAMEIAPDGWYTSWWPMPYARGATVELVNGSSQPISGEAQLVHAPSMQWVSALGPSGAAGYFGADARRGDTTQGQDWTLGDDLGPGKVVGVTAAMTGLTPGDGSLFNGPRGYLEGDEHVMADDVRGPTLQGTGTEDFFEGGWYFNRGPFSNPQNGNSAHELNTPDCQFACDSAYRTLIADAIPHQISLHFGIEHGGTDNMPAHYSTVLFHYGKLPS
ncbi:MAG: glycoside hydrolase family 172 protein [Pseudonocardiaceae bacterium]